MAEMKNMENNIKMALHQLENNMFEMQQNLQDQINALNQPDKADFKVLSSSNYNAETGVISLDIKNIGKVQATGYESLDYKRMVEVTPNAEESVELGAAPVGTKLTVRKPGKIEVWYIKGHSEFNLEVLESSTFHSNHGAEYVFGTEYSDWAVGTTIVTSTPPLHSNDTLHLKLKATLEAGRHYLLMADDLLFGPRGDTLEIVDGIDIPSNNFFVISP